MKAFSRSARLLSRHRASVISGPQTVAKSIRHCPSEPAVSQLSGPHWPRARQFSSTTPRQSAQTEKRTELYDLHVARGGKMVPFGGYQMPVQYDDLSVRESHLWTRNEASIFDVSHMVQHHLRGPGAEPLLNKLTPAGLASLPVHHSTLSALLLPVTGGIVDDCIITRLGPQHFYFVTNAGCREKDLKFLSDAIKEFKDDPSTASQTIDWEVLDNYSLIALQGPKAAGLLEPLIVEMQDFKLQNVHFGQSKFCTVRLPDGTVSLPLLISRGGYTGEDGFEISVASSQVVALTNALLAAGPDRIRLAGLGARDSLRLEAGMCLYGHDLNEDITPIEGSLAWIVSKDRRVEGSFHGADTILRQLTPKKDGGMGTERKRVGLTSSGPPAREGAEIYTADGETHIGTVTSGCPSPTLGKNIAMGYVATGHQKSGTEVQVAVRGKKHKGTITKMPFVPSKYWKGGVAPG